MKGKKNIFVEGEIPATKIAESIANHQSKTTIGAHSIFLGQVRADEINGETVTGINYETYATMAEEKMAVIREEIFQKYELTCMHVYHSVGLVEVGKICFFVFTSSKHRRAAIAACEEIVDRVKEELPIWGKEVVGEGEFHWKKNK